MRETNEILEIDEPKKDKRKGVPVEDENDTEESIEELTVKPKQKLFVAKPIIQSFSLPKTKQRGALLSAGPSTNSTKQSSKVSKRFMKDNSEINKQIGNKGEEFVYDQLSAAFLERYKEILSIPFQKGIRK